MFTRIASIVTSVATEIKARQAKRLVRKYLSVVDDRVQAVMPVMFGAYRRLSNVVIDKTVEDTTPLLTLVKGIQLCVAHYGPALKAESELFVAQTETLSISPKAIARAEKLGNAIAEFLDGIDTGSTK